MTELPVVCTLTPSELRSRRAALLPGLFSRATERHALANGLRVHFAAEGDILRAIADTLDAERQCCQFLRFDLTVEPDGGSIRLDVTGPEGTAEFLAALP
jgi:hypothetical protein